MKTKSRALSRADEASKELFDPVELELLNRYFGLPTKLDRAQLVEDPADAEERGHLSPGAAACAFGVRIEEGQTIDSPDEDGVLARAVGRICLQVIGRRRPPARRGSLETLLEADDSPEEAPYPAPLLFSIDWAMLSWEEQYSIVLVPGFDRFVVVKSSTPEMTGGAWLALGWFQQGEPVKASVGAIIRRWWSFQAEHEQARWEYFISKGLIREKDAEAWADEVWRDLEEEQVDEWAEEEDPDEASEEETTEDAE